MRVLLLFFLGCGLAEGRLETKCQVMRELREAITRRTDLVDEDRVANIICHTESEAGFNTSAVNKRSPGDGQPVWTFYGLFQLGNHLACRDGTSPSPNICGKDCTSFTDDDISDDIKCLVQILLMFVEKAFNVDHFEEFKTMITFIFRGECRDKKASEYFAECL